MPYIPKEERLKWERIIEEVVAKLDTLEVKDIDGNLNYFITSILKRIYPPKYFNYNRAMGLLECIKQEFYRRQIGNYEDKKIKENGDVQ
jgi:hypothetical protein